MHVATRHPALGLCQASFLTHPAPCLHPLPGCALGSYHPPMRSVALFVCVALVLAACSGGRGPEVGPGVGGAQAHAQSEAEAAWIASGGSVQRLDIGTATPTPLLPEDGYAWPGEPSVVLFAPIEPAPIEPAPATPPLSLLAPAVEEVSADPPRPPPQVVCVPGMSQAEGYAVFFAMGSAVPGAEGAQVVEEAAALWRAGLTPRLTLTGYASPEGLPEANLDLSARRVVAVAKALQGRGVPLSAMMVRALGSAHAPPGTDADVEALRRVDIALSPTEEGA